MATFASKKVSEPVRTAHDSGGGLRIDSRTVFVLAAAAILFYQLILPPVVGLADNGDFVKVIARFNLYARVHNTYQYIDTVYHFLPEKHWVSPFFSIEIPLVYPALWLNSLVSKTGDFDLRCIGVVHGALFLWALWLFAPLLGDARRWIRWTIYALVILVFCDVMYVNTLNSFYMDEPALLFLLLTVVFFLRVLKWRRKFDAVALMLCPFLMVSAKGQHALLGIWIAALFVAASNALRPVRPVQWRAAGVCLIAASLLMLWKAQPADYTADAVYNVVFEEILPHSHNVSRTLADLGLEDADRSHMNMKAFLPGSGMDDPVFRARFIRTLSFGKLAVFYIRHPAVTYKTIRDGLSKAGAQHAFGNFDTSTGYPPFTESQAFSVWSGIKRHFFNDRGPRFLFAFLALATVLGILAFRQRYELPKGALAAVVCLIGGAFTEMGLATLCDSMDLTRHCLIFFVLFDMIALGCAYLALRRVDNWKEAFHAS